MDQQNALEYYVTRAATSRRLSAQALSPGIAAIHQEFAERYDRLIDSMAPQGEYPSLTPIDLDRAVMNGTTVQPQAYRQRR